MQTKYTQHKVKHYNYLLNLKICDARRPDSLANKYSQGGQGPKPCLLRLKAAKGGQLCPIFKTNPPLPAQ